jgi:hypothetical protein
MPSPKTSFWEIGDSSPAEKPQIEDVRTRVPPSIEAAMAAWLITFMLTASSFGCADSGRVVRRPAQTFRGWGRSLALEANELNVGGGEPARIKSPKLH